jgi:hypothetical protein
MLAQKISAWLGIALAVIGAPLKVLRIMRESEPLPWMAYDYIALILLVTGAVLVLRGKGGRLLAAGWGFGIAMFYESFFSHYEQYAAGTGNHGFQRTMVASTAAFLVVNIIGLALALMKPKTAAD